jgi:hypothetical protein
MDIADIIIYACAFATAILGVIGMALSLRLPPPSRPDVELEKREEGKDGESESGNVFFAIIGVIALLGVATMGVNNFIRGPLATSVKISRQNVAENQMMIGAQVAVMAASSQANNGDCDGDTMIEPVEWRDAGTSPAPTGGGLIPLSIGTSKKDPWGTEYGYCTWDHGSQINGGGTCGGSGQKRLAGTNSNAYPAVALISAGPDKAFQTTCLTFAAADDNDDGDLLDADDLQLVSKTADSDDLIFTYTYEEATGASGGLWSLKSGAPDTAVINKDIEVGGTGMFDRVGATGSDYLEVVSGLKLADPSSMPVCNAANVGVMRLNASSNGVEMCDGVSAWSAISGSGSAFDPNATCTGPADAGKVRYNASTSQPEFCDGTQWRVFTLNSNVANLVFTPTTQSGMDVDGSNNLDTTICTGLYYCGPGYTFSLQNQGGTTSAVISVSLTNSTNFAKTADSCHGTTLAAGASCTIVIKPKADGNTSYTGNLQATANNNPFVVMQGTSTNFGCLPGRTAPGGKYAGCGLTDSATGESYDLVAMPSGCNGVTTNPTCSGATDTLRKVGSTSCCSTSVCMATTGLCDDHGPQNTVNLMTLTSISSHAFPAASYCDSMIYGGFSDWYLPSSSELVNYVYPNKVAVGGLTTADAYWSSNFNNNSTATAVYMSSGSTSWHGTSNTLYVRCFRRDNIALPTATADTSPSTIGIAPQVVFTPGAQATSNTITVSGILQTISVSMTGGPGMNIIKNGVSTGSTSISGVRVGDTLAFQMDGPATLGTKSNATITLGSQTVPWWVGYADSSIQVKAFVTSVGYQGNIGGLAGADAKCNTLAAASPYGLPSKWKAILSSSTVAASSRIPWNWGTLKTVTGTTIVDGGFPDLWDGTLDNPINTSELGDVVNAWTMTGSNATGNPYNIYGVIDTWFCADWTTNSGSWAWNMTKGNAAASSSAWMDNLDNNITSGCSGSFRFYCIEDIDDPSDTTPNDMTIPYKIQVAAGSRQSSDPVTVGGLSFGVSATLSVSATGGTPTFTKNGGGEVTSAPVRNGDVLIFKMDAPAGVSASNNMTITAGGMTAYWRVWTGDNGANLTKRVFVTAAKSRGNLGGVTGADSVCQSAATGAGLSGTWKAIISGGSAQPEWAVNRVGYNWSTLTLVDGTPVVYAPNLWTSSPSLMSPIVKTQTGATLANQDVYTNTTALGFPVTQTEASICQNWTSNAFVSPWSAPIGNSSVQSAGWINTGAKADCGYNGGTASLYCIEQ